MPLNVTLERAVGSGADWSKGYSGALYVATVETKNVEEIVWILNGEEAVYTIKVKRGLRKKLKCKKVRGTGIRGVTVECKSRRKWVDFYSTLILDRGLGLSNDGNVVEFKVRAEKLKEDTSRSSVLSVKSL